MVDSVSVSVGGEVAAGVSDSLVVGEAGCEREQSERDAAGEAGEGAGAVAFEAELAFAVQNTDSIHCRTGPRLPKRRGSSLRSGRR